MAISRTPPSAVRWQLRSEVGFGCPMCGSPHLEYHHFDPLFSEEPHHRPEGMIALCATHHAQADGLTKEQIRKIKSNKKLHVSSNFLWRRKHTVFVCGGICAYKCNTMLRVMGFDLIFFENDIDGYETLSLNIYDRCLNPILVMRQNDWISRTDVDDLHVPPGGRTMQMHSKIRGVAVEIEFKDRQRLDRRELAVANDLSIPSDENVVFCYFRGEIAAPVPVVFKQEGIEIGGMTIGGGVMSYCDTGIQVA